jgi:hypothetical protein
MRSSNHMSFSSFSRTVLSAAVAIVVAAPALAQNTTAAIGGRVTGMDGKPVPGASVSVVHTESGTTSTIFSDADGRYAARGLRVGGPYTISVSKDGKIEKIEGVFLQLAEAGSVDVKLGSAAALNTVVVTGSSASAVFDSGNKGAGTQLGRKELEAYASVQRNLQDYARLDPRLSQTDKDRGEISALGQNSRFNSITIDGVSINDSFGLESNNLPTAKQPISIDAIQSVQVNIANFDVTQKGYTGANINAVTKSGTNDVKGSVYYVYRDNKMTGDRYNRPTDSYSAVADFKESTKGITVGGPLIKDKLFFFASIEDQRSSRATPAFGPVGSSLTNVGITNAQIAAVAATAKAKYNVDIGGLDVPSGTELTAKDYTLKFDWNINDQHRANLRISKIEQLEPIFYGFGTRALSYNSHWTAEKKTLETKVAQWFADWTPTFSTELKLSKRDNPKTFENNSVLPQVSLVFTGTAPAGTTSGDRTLRFGTEEFRHLNELRTNTTDVYFAGNWAVGSHEVKAGVDFSSNDIYNAFLSGTNGVYEFRGADPVALLNAGKPTSYSVQVAQPGSTLNDGIANWNLKNLGLFVQDTIAVTDRLNINAGIRFDRASTSDRPKANLAAQKAFGYDNTVTIDGQTLVQPRFGFNYEMETDEKRKSQVRGGLGLFQGGAANVWLSNPFSNPGVATRTFSCNNAQASSQCPTNLVFTPDTKKQPELSGAIPAAAVDIISPDLKQPSVWKLNLALDKELPWYGLVLGAEWIHTRTNSGITYRHLNLGSATAISPDGRELYYNAGGRSENCWTGAFAIKSGCGNTRANRNTQFTDVVLAESSASGSGNALTLSLASPGRGGLGWMVAYTRTDANEVNPLTSSRAISNWGGRSVVNPNEDTTGPSNYLVKDRFTGALNWSKAFVANYKTSFGLVYEGRTGKPYSWTFNNDMNGDGLAGNDLLYIPKAPGSGEVLFYGATAAAQKANEDQFWAIVNSESSLSGVRGGVVGRNNATAKFTNTFDLRISQELPGFFAKHKGSIALDILNVGNLLNKEWGRIDEVGFQSAGGLARSFVNYAGIKDGKYIYNVQPLEDYVTRNSKNESQWAAQITLKYEF